MKSKHAVDRAAVLDYLFWLWTVPGVAVSSRQVNALVCYMMAACQVLQAGP